MKILDSSIIPVMSLLSLAVASSVQAYPLIAQQEYIGANNVVAVSGTVGSPTDPTAFGVLIDGTGAISNNSVSNTGILFSGTSAYWISSIGSNVNAVIALDASISGIANNNTLVNSGSLFGTSEYGTGVGIGVGSSNFVNGNVIQNTGVISVSGYYTGMGIGITGQTINSNTLTNSGIISVGSNASAFGFELYANNTSIGNNTILNSGTMSLSSLDNAYFASLYANGPISGNTITNLGDVTVGSLYSVAYGASLYSSSYGISGNTISNQGTLNLISPYNSTYGVYIEGNADVTGNTITNSGTAILNGANYSSGVYLYSDNGAVRNNSISNLGTLSITSGGIDGVYLYGQSEVSGNTFLNSGNITLTATNGSGYGLDLYSSDGRVAYNTLTNQGGLFVSATNSSAYAISLQSYADIVHNAITNTGTIQFDSYYNGYGVWLESYDGTISSNTITNQGVFSGTSNSSIYGIGLQADNYGSVTGNTILNSGLLSFSAGEEVYPIYLYSSDGGISANTITNTGSIVASSTNNSGYGVYLAGRSDVTGNSISNLGSLQVTSNGSGVGIQLNSWNAQVSNNVITNKGTLSVTSLNSSVNGIYLEADNYGAVSGNTISNSGVFNLSAPSDIYSIYLYSNDGAVINNTITNSGSLVASSSNGTVYGIYAYADSYDPASNNTIINSGTIRLNAGSDAYPVYLYSSDGAVNNNVITNTGIIAASSTGGSVYGFQLYGDYMGSVSGNTITNTGLVQLSSQYDAYGAYLYSSYGDVSNNTIINQGTLSLVSSGSYGSSNVIGIYLQGDGNMLGNKVLNNGTLSVSGSSYFVEGVELYSSNANVSDSTLINSGKLLLSTAGNYAYGMWIDPEYTANNNVISNTGTLVLTGSSDYAYGISIETVYGDATNNTVTNTGNIVVNTTTGSAYGISVVSGSDYASSYGSGNKVVNFGNITVSGSDAYGIYVESGSNNSVVNWGTINANSGTGTAIAVVGDNNTITLAGHSTVSGTLVGTGNNNVLSLSFTGVSSKIKADLVSQLNSIGALSGTATSGTFNFRGQTYTYDPLVVQVNTSSYKDQGKTPNQKAVGASLDSFSINPTGQMLSLLNALDFSGNVANGLEQLSPQRYQVYGDIALSNAGLLTGLIDQRLANVRSGSESIDTSGLGVSYGSAQSKLGMGDSKQTVTIDKNGKTTMEPISDKRWSAFLSGVVSFVDIDGSNLQQDSKYTDAGVVGGVDVKLTDAWTAGLLGGYANSDVDLDSQGSSATVDSYSGGLYSGYRNEGFYGNGLAAYTRNNYDSVRKIDIPGYKRSADGSTSGSQYTFNIDGGYDHPVTKNVTVGPFAGLQYVHMGVDSFTETGAGAANLKLNDQNMDSLRSRLGVRVELRKELTASWTVASEVRAAWQHEFANNDRAIVSQFNGSGFGAFSVRTSSPERDRALVGVGINATYRDTLTTFVDYDAEVGSNYVGQILKGGLKLKF